MASFRYRALAPDGAFRNGVVEATDLRQAVVSLNASGISVIDVSVIPEKAAKRAERPTAKVTSASAMMIGELAVLLRAGLPLDRGLALAIGNIEPRPLAQRFTPLLAEVREGRPLSGAFARAPDLLTPTAVAMTEAGEANGKLPDALDRLGGMLESGAELRRLVITSSIYPVALLVISVGVILLMLLLVVPQFDSLIGHSTAKLPAASQFVLGASHFLRDNWLALVVGVLAIGFGFRFLLARPAARAALDRIILGVPQIGPLIQRLETARFSRTLGALVEGEVPLPNAVRLAQRTIANSHIAAAMSKIADGVREGGGFATALASAKVFPDIALGFIRTGEESSQLGMMLTRLADVLDRDIRVRLERLVAVATPLITVVLGASVAGIIASIMSAILGFNELAITQ